MKFSALLPISGIALAFLQQLKTLIGMKHKFSMAVRPQVITVIPKPLKKNPPKKSGKKNSKK